MFFCGLKLKNMESLRFKALDNLSKGLPKVKVEGSAQDHCHF